MSIYKSQDDRNVLYQDAIAAWGWEAQVDMAVEELAECTVAIQKLFKRDFSAKRYADLASEVADVTIMMEEIRYILDTGNTPEGVDENQSFSQLVAEQVLYKLNRTRTRIDMAQEIQNRAGQE